MVRDEQLYRRAIQACRDYRAICGKYPPKVGIHLNRFRLFRYNAIVLYEPTEPSSRFFLADLNELPEPRFRVCYVPFAPVLGPFMQYDEVYVPVSLPGKPERAMSAEQLAEIREAIERFRRYGWEDIAAQVQRAIFGEE